MDVNGKGLLIQPYGGYMVVQPSQELFPLLCKVKLRWRKPAIGVRVRVRVTVSWGLY